MINQAINKVVERIDLEEDEMAEVIEQIMEGGATPSQIASFLTALRMKGESVSEITGAARVILDKANRITTTREAVVDLCGTGGDYQGTYNVSTTASFIVAGAGIAVAKHGNHAQQCLEETGIVFLFAPIYHPAMKNVAVTRKEIGIRTIFNILGPISNPAGVRHQVIGVYSEALLDPVIKVLRNLGHINAMVIHGSDAMDELTVTGKTVVAELRDGMVKKYQLDPSELGLKKRKLEELKGGKTPEENAQIVLSVLKGEEKEAKRDIALLNAAAAIYVSDSDSDFNQAFQRAVESLDSGNALSKLNQFIEYTKR